MKSVAESRNVMKREKAVMAQLKSERKSYAKGFSNVAPTRQSNNAACFEAPDQHGKRQAKKKELRRKN